MQNFAFVTYQDTTVDRIINTFSAIKNVFNRVLMFSKEPRFNSDNHEKAWLLRTAGNLSKNKIKHNRVRSSEQLDEACIISSLCGYL